MTKNSLLEGITIVDFSARLPGPLASQVLSSLGASIIKLENTDIGGDPFNNDAYTNDAPYFKDWYQQLNAGKEIVSLGFEEDKEKIKSLIESSDLILINESKYLLNYIKDLSPKPTLIISAGKGQFRFLHDLNAMGVTKVFKEHLKNSSTPPFLPFAGMIYGQQLATTALALILKSQKTNEQLTQTIYLKDTTEDIFNLLHSDQYLPNGKFLHNGAFPCYNTYELKDGAYVCLGAVEDKFWIPFTQCFDLQLSVEDKFDLSGKVHNILKKLFAKYNSSEIKEKIVDKELCLTISSK